jgi:hypothetical protein
LEDVLLEDHLKTCVMHHDNHKKDSKMIGEILEVYRLKRK